MERHPGQHLATDRVAFHAEVQTQRLEIGSVEKRKKKTEKGVGEAKKEPMAMSHTGEERKISEVKKLKDLQKTEELELKERK